MKKIINQPERVVREMIEGLVGIHAGWSRLQGQNAVLRADFIAAREQQVALISGGGSGHEPAHIGFVGAGMLSAAVAGEVFTSPSADAVLAAIKAVAGSPGVLLIVKNYTGDRLNFGLAAEMARAEGIHVALCMWLTTWRWRTFRIGPEGVALPERSWSTRSREPPRRKAEACRM